MIAMSSKSICLLILAMCYDFHSTAMCHDFTHARNANDIQVGRLDDPLFPEAGRRKIEQA